jgi:5'-nucleotidase
MSAESWIVLLGSVAALCSTGAFIPQIVRTYRQGGRDLSYGMLVLYLAGVGLWLGYGILTGASAVVVANAATGFLVGVALFLKWRAERAPLAAIGTSARRLRVAIDMDDVLADTIAKQLRAYNAAFDANLTREHLQGRSLEETVPADRAAATSGLVLAPGFFRDLEVMPESQEVVRALAERYEVFIASAAMEVPTSFADKYAWLREHFPFIPPSHVVFCGDKGVLDVDYLIDDTARQFRNFRGVPVLFTAPHNRGETRYLRVHGWRDVARILLRREPPALAATPAPDLVPTA